MRWVRGIVLFLPHGVETQTCSNSSENLCESEVDRANMDLMIVAIGCIE